MFHEVHQQTFQWYRWTPGLAGVSILAVMVGVVVWLITLL